MKKYVNLHAMLSCCMSGLYGRKTHFCSSVTLFGEREKNAIIILAAYHGNADQRVQQFGRDWLISFGTGLDSHEILDRYLCVTIGV